jgi:hypothetical protein
LRKLIPAVLIVAFFAAVAAAIDVDPKTASVARPDVVRAERVTIHPFIDVASIGTTETKIFISDSVNDAVDIYNTSGKLLGQIVGFSGPQGLATDGKGNLYVADTGNSRIQIYAPPYKKVAKSLSDADEYPVGVSVLNDGEFVAVTNILSSSGGAGSVVVYKNGEAGAPITNSNFAEVYFAAFDGKGNIYVDGTNSSRTFEIGEIVDATGGGKTLKTLKYSGTIGFPGGIQATIGNKIAVEDQENSTVYTFNPPKNGVLGSPVATTPLNGAGDIVAFVFTQDGKGLWGSDAANEDAAKYAYAKGGNAITTFAAPGGGIAIVPAEIP